MKRTRPEYCATAASNQAHPSRRRVGSVVFGLAKRGCRRPVSQSQTLGERRLQNRDKKPGDFSYGSEQYAWWQCDRYTSHACRARINSRTGIDHTGCPRCAAIAGKGVRKTPEDLAQIRAMREAVAIA